MKASNNIQTEDAINIQNTDRGNMRRLGNEGKQIMIL